MSVKRGDIVLANLEPVMGSEQGKIRPCVVIQNDLGNITAPTTIVAAMTSSTEHQYPFTVLVEKGEANLQSNSLIMLNQIRTISIEDRILKKIGSLKPATMKKIDDAIKTSLALE